MVGFNPNSLTFKQGVERLTSAAKEAGLKTNKIVTSRDKEARLAVDKLIVKNVPAGFSKWQLPVYLACESQFFMSFAAPNTPVSRHSHDEGPGVRVILNGSIYYNGVELGEGDWMYIPKGEEYSFTVGPRGAGMFYCYCCCCA